MLMVTVASSSRVEILRVPGVPPVFPRWDSSGTTNQKFVSVWAWDVAEYPANIRVKPKKMKRFMADDFLLMYNIIRNLGSMVIF